MFQVTPFAENGVKKGKKVVILSRIIKNDTKKKDLKMDNERKITRDEALKALDDLWDDAKMYDPYYLQWLEEVKKEYDLVKKYIMQRE